MCNHSTKNRSKWNQHHKKRSCLLRWWTNSCKFAKWTPLSSKWLQKQNKKGAKTVWSQRSYQEHIASKNLTDTFNRKQKEDSKKKNMWHLYNKFCNGKEIRAHILHTILVLKGVLIILLLFFLSFFNKENTISLKISRSIEISSTNFCDEKGSV